jgi:hypothetical protein
MLEILTPMVIECVLNQSRGYWLLFDAIISTISLCVMMKYNTNFGINDVM